MTGAHLNYNIAEMTLSGLIDGCYISCKAFSGGRGGTKTPGAVNDSILNNPLLTNLSAEKSANGYGGPLPIGSYTLSLHESKPNEIRLNPTPGTRMMGRGGMLIHGRGKIGSQGCIVPESFGVVQRIYSLVKVRQEKGLEPVSLKVFATGDIDFYQDKINAASQIT